MPGTGVLQALNNISENSADSDAEQSDAERSDPECATFGALFFSCAPETALATLAILERIDHLESYLQHRHND